MAGRALTLEVIGGFIHCMAGFAIGRARLGMVEMDIFPADRGMAGGAISSEVHDRLHIGMAGGAVLARSSKRSVCMTALTSNLSVHPLQREKFMDGSLAAGWEQDAMRNEQTKIGHEIQLNQRHEYPGALWHIQRPVLPRILQRCPSRWRTGRLRHGQLTPRQDITESIYFIFNLAQQLTCFRRGDRQVSEYRRDLVGKQFQLIFQYRPVAFRCDRDCALSCVDGAFESCQGFDLRRRAGGFREVRRPALDNGKVIRRSRGVAANKSGAHLLSKPLDGEEWAGGRDRLFICNRQASACDQEDQPDADQDNG